MANIAAYVELLEHWKMLSKVSVHPARQCQRYFYSSLAAYLNIIIIIIIIVIIIIMSTARIQRI